MAGSKVISHVEILSASDVGQRRGWADEDKIRIVQESLFGARQGAATARRHGISRSLLTRWRREFREGALRAEGPLGFTPLQIVSDVPRPAPAKCFPVIHQTKQGRFMDRPKLRVGAR